MLKPDVEIVQSWQLDKNKRDLFKKLRVKTEIEIIKKYSEIDSMHNSSYTHKYGYDKNGNRLRHEFFTDSLMSKLYSAEDYVTDENGNVLEAYRKGKLIGTQEFDDEGRIIELINYDEDGGAKWSYEYEYDEMGNEIFETQYFYGELIDTLLYIKFEYESIDDKILIKSKECLLDTSNVLYEENEFFVYDSLGREIQYQEFRRDKSIYFIRNTDYKTLSRIRKFYFPDGSIEQIDSIKINLSGKEIERFTYKNGILTRKNFNTYNQKGIMLSELRLSEAGKKFFELKYNEIGQEIYSKSFINDTLRFMRSSEYLENGLIIKSEEKDFGKKSSRLDIYEYEFY